MANGKVLIACGTIGGESRLASAELYDPATGTWSFTSSLNLGRINHTQALLGNDLVLMAGGASAAGNEASAELYDQATGHWTFTGSLSTDRILHTATLLQSGRVLVAGGQAGLNFNTAELYDTATETWSVTGNLNQSRLYHTATLMGNGEVLVVGDYPFFDTTELYDPPTGLWTITGNLNKGRYATSATLLLLGKVLAAGGTKGGRPLSSAELMILESLLRRRRRVAAQSTGKVIQPLSTLTRHNRLIGRLAHSLSTTPRPGSPLQRREFGPGTSDIISISLTNGYSASGTLTSGDIRIH